VTRASGTVRLPIHPVTNPSHNREHIYERSSHQFDLSRCPEPTRARDGVQRIVLAMEVRDTGDIEASTRSDEEPLSGLTVLLVEDNADSRGALAFMLQSVGARVREAQDGPEALEALAARMADVVLADMRMPGMDGCELARQVRATPALSRVRLIAVSGVAEPESIAVARAAGFDDYVVKPVDANVLIATLRQTVPAPHPFV
jgi:CheY-like chemotaxis protein